MDTVESGRLKGPLPRHRGGRHRVGPARRAARALAAVVWLTVSLAVLASPAAGAGPLPDVSPPVDVPSVPLPTPPVATPRPPTPRPPTLPPPPTAPLPTVPLPTVPLPTVPVPTPTLPVPTPTLPLPTPTLPLPTPTLPTLPIPTPTVPLASPSPVATTTAGASSAIFLPGGAADASAVPLGGGAVGSIGPEGVPSPGPGDAVVPTIGGSGFGSLFLPGLLIGVPTFIVLGILIAQLAVGAAWLPIIRRWLNRRVS